MSTSSPGRAGPGSSPASSSRPEERDRLQRERRRFVRDRHPDVGGDVGEFAAGLAAFDRRLAALGRVGLDGPDRAGSERAEAPARVTGRSPTRGPARLVATLSHWVHRQHVPPRVH